MLVYQRVYWLSGCPASVQAPKNCSPSAPRNWPCWSNRPPARRKSSRFFVRISSAAEGMEPGLVFVNRWDGWDEWCLVTWVTWVHTTFPTFSRVGRLGRWIDFWVARFARWQFWWWTTRFDKFQATGFTGILGLFWDNDNTIFFPDDDKIPEWSKQHLA